MAGLLTAVATAAGAPPDSLYTSLRNAPLAGSVSVANIVLHRDAGTLTLKTGTIAFTPPAMGRDTVALFVGEGEFTLTPAADIEKNYLRNLTGQEQFQETFDRALLCFTDDTGNEIRARIKASSSDARPADAARDLQDVLRDFRKKLRTPEAFGNIEAELLMDLYRPAQTGFFTAYLHGRKRSDLHFQVRPRAAIPFMGPEEVMLYAVQPNRA